MNPEDFLETGYISKAHGMKGDLRAVFEPKDLIDLDEFLELPVHYLLSKGTAIQPFILESISVPNERQILLKYEGIDNRVDAEAMVGKTLLFPKEELTEMEDGYYYYYEVRDFQVVDEQLGPLGKVTDFVGGKIHDIMMMNYKGFEVLIPVVDHIVGKANFEKKEIYTSLPEGLIEVYTHEDQDD